MSSSYSESRRLSSLDTQESHTSTASSKSGLQSENYFNLRDIVTSHERVSVTFQIPVLNLGHLDPASESENIEPRSNFDIPLWLAKAIYAHHNQAIIPEMHKVYKESYREISRADPWVVDLRHWGPNYYDLGLQLIEFRDPESVDICQTMLQVFQNRFRLIMDYAQSEKPSTEVLDRFDNKERSLYDTARRLSQVYRKWETRQSMKLTTSQMVANHKKRKRAAMEES